ncbi:hypothetical protein [Phocaeicola salanitronis]
MPRHIRLPIPEYQRWPVLAHVCPLGRPTQGVADGRTLSLAGARELQPC